MAKILIFERMATPGIVRLIRQVLAVTVSEELRLSVDRYNANTKHFARIVGEEKS